MKSESCIMMDDYAVILDRVSKQYVSRPTPAIDELSFSVRKGSFFGLLGPNGSGKSTTLNILSHLIRPDRGLIQIQGWDYATQSFQAKQSLGIVPQEFNFNIFDTPEDIILNQGGYYGHSRSSLKDRLKMLLHKLDLTQHAHRPARTLSGGMKRRLMIARALIHSPQILILDEPTAGVDPQLRQEIWSFLKELNQQGTTIILTSHYFEEVEELCDEVAMIQSGRMLLQLPMQEFLSRLPQHTIQIELQSPASPEVQKSLLTQAPQLSFISPQIFLYAQKQQEPLRDLMELFERHNLEVLTVAPKKARLEQLFLSMITPQEL